MSARRGAIGAQSHAAQWLTDANGNRASVEYFGTIEAAQAALDGLKGCTDCTNCTNCTDCTLCAYCSGCLGCTHSFDCLRCTYCHYCRRLSDRTYCAGMFA